MDSSKPFVDRNDYRQWYLAQKPANVAWGECFCGCGETTLPANQTHTRYGWFKGEPRRYLKGHNRRLKRTGPSSPAEYHKWYLANKPDGIAWGECWCGCRRATSVAAETHAKVMKFKDKPRRFISGHQNASSLNPKPRYVEEDRGYDTPCWVWQRSVSIHGYAREGRGRLKMHRVYYEHIFGRIPEHEVLHHKCGIRRCVNPQHLQSVTNSEHARLHWIDWHNRS